MWCKYCRQDVPALPSADKQTFCCPRCGDDICAEPRADAPRTAATDFPAASAEDGIGTASPPSYDDWELDEQIRQIQRTLRSGRLTDDRLESICRRESMRLDAPHAGMPSLHLPPLRQQSARRETVPPSGDVLAAIKWLVLILGGLGFAAGGLLLTGSLLTGRQGLWNLGLSMALVGQVGLLVGLVLQLDRLWRDNREAVAKLEEVDEQLNDLKATTTLLGTTQGPAATTFYSHFTGGASPQLLLTDLKSQIDLLAMKIAKDQR